MIHLQHNIQLAEDLISHLQKLDSYDQKASFLLGKTTFDKKNHSWIAQFSAYEQYLLLSPIALGQAKEYVGCSKKHLVELLHTLDDVERFYETIGGIIGYHLAVLKLLVEQKDVHKQEYLQPLKLDIHTLTDQVFSAIRSGVEQLHLLAELYPVGGAGDRLALVCPEEQEPLPAAQLPFLGTTLLEGLIHDLQAREYLHFKLTGRQLTTPIALMTSHEKANDARVRKILEDNRYFGRPSTSFRLFKQPMVPVITEEGDWIVADALQLQLKPGGHGAIWRLAILEGIFDWFQEEGRTKGLVRQINNPIAGIDYGIMAFTGIGLAENKAFGFAACPRMVHNAEGTDVLVETKTGEGYTYTLSNIEYTEFERRGIEDRPTEDGGMYSAFPANTNILFFDIDEIRKAVKVNPIPGMILNMKTKMKIGTSEISVGRLESTMQNISDAIVAHFHTKPSEAELRAMPVYLTYNERRKTLSVTKNSYDPKKSAVGTPEGCFYEWLENMHELFTCCGMKLPPLPSLKAYLQSGPSFNIHYHPALGPIFHVIAQKIRGGTLKPHSELVLHIAEIELVNLDLEGSCIIRAECIMGKTAEDGLLLYGSASGKCTMLNCKIVNAGIEKNSSSTYWKQDISRAESMKIDIQGNGEFFAENVTFVGNHSIIVRDKHRVVAQEKEGQVIFRETRIDNPTWSWSYSFDNANRIVLDSGR